MENDPHLNPPPAVSGGFTGILKRASETRFYRKTLVFRSAYLRGGIGIAIAMLTADMAKPGDTKNTVLAGLIAWRLFIDSSMGDAKEQVKKVL